LNIQVRAADHDGPFATASDVCNSHIRSGMPLVKRKGLAWISDVYEVVWDAAAFIGCWFGGANVHAAIHLHRIGIDALATTGQLLGKLNCKAGLATSSWPNDHNGWAVLRVVGW
jgi:hypothetical protein